MIISDSPIPLLGKIYQYKEEHNLKIVACDIPKQISPNFHIKFQPSSNVAHCQARNFLDRNNLASYYSVPSYTADYDTAEMRAIYRSMNIIAYQIDDPTRAKIAAGEPITKEESDGFLHRLTTANAQVPMYSSIGPENNIYLNQEPWSAFMPFGHLKNAAGKPSLIPQPSFSQTIGLFGHAVKVSKYTIVPLREKTVETKFRNSNVVAARATFVYCSIARFDQETGFDEIPQFEWLRTSWLQPHTGKSYEKEHKARVQALIKQAIIKARS